MKNRVKELEQLLKTAQVAYYKGKPIMQDDEYDALFDELVDLDSTNKVLVTVGYKIDDTTSTPLEKARHKIPMGSQKKVNTQDEFTKWVKKTKTRTFVIQEKLDGISVELVYDTGKLIAAITRGDGDYGEDITHNVQHMQNVYKHLKAFSGSLRAEIVFKKSEFAQHAAEDYANERNAAAGISRKKDVSPLAKRLSLIYFDVVDDSRIFDTEYDKIEYIKKYLMLKPVFTKRVRVDNAIDWYNHYAEEKREALDYDIDGLVFKVNNVQRQEKLGDVDNRPRGQIAWKFAAEMRHTTVVSISWEVGLTGRITPVCHVVPVRVGGVTIEKASLHTANNVRKLRIGSGATVLVSRRNDVIPYVESVVSEALIADIPTTCTVCNAAVIEDGEYLFCSNDDCAAKQQGDIKKWIKVLGMDFIGESFIDQAMQKGIITDAADLYTLTADLITVLDKHKAGSAKRILRSINKTREIALPKFFAALNIPGVGVSAFTALEKNGYDTVTKVVHARAASISSLPGIGEKTSKALVEGVVIKEPLIRKLLDNGVIVKQKAVGKLTGMSFCFTGQIALKRETAMKCVESLGGEIKTSVSRGLTYLVQANAKSTSGKSKKARGYGTKVIGDQEFMKLIEFSYSKVRDLV